MDARKRFEEIEDKALRGNLLSQYMLAVMILRLSPGSTEEKPFVSSQPALEAKAQELQKDPEVQKLIKEKYSESAHRSLALRIIENFNAKNAQTGKTALVLGALLMFEQETTKENAARLDEILLPILQHGTPEMFMPIANRFLELAPEGTYNAFLIFKHGFTKNEPSCQRLMDLLRNQVCKEKLQHPEDSFTELDQARKEKLLLDAKVVAEIKNDVGREAHLKALKILDNDIHAPLTDLQKKVVMAHLNKAAALDYANAHFVLVSRYCTGDACEKNEVKALDHLVTAAKLGEPESSKILRGCLLNIKKDPLAPKEPKLMMNLLKNTEVRQRLREMISTPEKEKAIGSLLLKNTQNFLSLYGYGLVMMPSSAPKMEEVAQAEQDYLAAQKSIKVAEETKEENDAINDAVKLLMCAIDKGHVPSKFVLSGLIARRFPKLSLRLCVEAATDGMEDACLTFEAIKACAEGKGPQEDYKRFSEILTHQDAVVWLKNANLQELRKGNYSAGTIDVRDLLPKFINGDVEWWLSKCAPRLAMSSENLACLGAVVNQSNTLKVPLVKSVFIPECKADAAEMTSVDMKKTIVALREDIKAKFKKITKQLELVKGTQLYAPRLAALKKEFDNALNFLDKILTMSMAREKKETPVQITMFKPELKQDAMSVFKRLVDEVNLESKNTVVLKDVKISPQEMMQCKKTPGFWELICNGLMNGKGRELFDKLRELKLLDGIFGERSEDDLNFIAYRLSQYNDQIAKGKLNLSYDDKRTAVFALWLAKDYFYMKSLPLNSLTLQRLIDTNGYPQMIEKPRWGEMIFSRDPNANLFALIANERKAKAIFKQEGMVRQNSRVTL